MITTVDSLKSHPVQSMCFIQVLSILLAICAYYAGIIFSMLLLPIMLIIVRLKPNFLGLPLATYINRRKVLLLFN